MKTKKIAQKLKKKKKNDRVTSVIFTLNFFIKLKAKLELIAKRFLILDTD